MAKISIAFACLCLFVGCGNTSDVQTGKDAAPAPGNGGGRGTGGAMGAGGVTTAVATGGAAAGGASSGTGGGAAGRSGSGGVLPSDAGRTTGGAATTDAGGGSGGTAGTAIVATGKGGQAAGGASAASGGQSTAGSSGQGGRAAGGSSSGAGGDGGSGDAGVGGAAGAGTGGGSGPAGQTGSCTTPPDPSPLLGWASESGGGVTTTTGGGNATPTTVTSLADLQSAAKGTTAAVIYVKGKMAAGTVTVGSNKTIVGLCGAEIHGHVEVSGSTNVIIRNIKIVGYAVGNCALDPSYDSSTGCSSGQDAISVQKNAHHIWFDHCDISDGTDGNLDITNAANYVTVSWTKFHYTPRTDNSGSDSTGAAGHRFSNLVGGTDSPSSYDDASALNVTWHHNWWADNVMERQPRVRFGKNHVFNNLYTAAGDNYCVRAGIEAKLLIQNNVFAGVKDPHVFNSTSDQGTAYITASGNTYPSSTGTEATGGGGTPFTTPPYTFTLDATASLQSTIQAGAGPH